MGDLKKMCCDWSYLPVVIEEVLAWLPVDSLCRFRSVCKEWNDLITSTRFITRKWAEKPPNRNPSLVFVKVKESGSSLVFVEVKESGLASCLFNRTWNKPSSISLSFVRHRQEEETTYCWGSAAGLFLMEYKSAFASAFVVCNPLTTTSLQLPPFSSIEHIQRMFIEGGKEDSRDTYIVVGVGQTRNWDPDTYIVEIYNSTDKSWRIAGQLKLDSGFAVREMVYCKGYFYWTRRDFNGILGYNIQEGLSIFAPFPDGINHELLTCGSRLLLTGFMLIPDEDTEEDLPVYDDSKDITDEDMHVILWEFDKAKVNSFSSSSISSASWKEIARMPEIPGMPLSFSEEDIMGMIVLGVGDCVCYISSSEIDVVAYHVIEDTWSWLPNHILGHHASAWLCERALSIYPGPDRKLPVAFEPRPDMKV